MTFLTCWSCESMRARSSLLTVTWCIHLYKNISYYIIAMYMNQSWYYTIIVVDGDLILERSLGRVHTVALLLQILNSLVEYFVLGLCLFAANLHGRDVLIYIIIYMSWYVFAYMHLHTCNGICVYLLLTFSSSSLTENMYNIYILICMSHVHIYINICIDKCM